MQEKAIINIFIVYGGGIPMQYFTKVLWKIINKR